MHAMLNLDDQIPLLLDAAMELTGAHVALLVLRQADGKLELIGERYSPLVKAKDGAKFSRSIIEQVITTNQPRFILDTKQTPDVDERESVQALQLRAVMAAPLQSRSGVFGALYVHSKAPIASFNEAQKEIFLALRGMAAVALDNARTHSAIINDGSTGLYSYSYGRLMLEQELVMAQKRNQDVSLALVSLEAPELSRAEIDAVARLVKTAVRRVDTVLRYRRNQWAIVIPDSSEQTLNALVDKMRAQAPPASAKLVIGFATAEPSKPRDVSSLEEAAEKAHTAALAAEARRELR